MISLGGWDNEFTQAIGLIARQVNGCDDTVPDISKFPWVADTFPATISDKQRVKVVDCYTEPPPAAPSRRNFIIGLWSMACKYGFDGVDIDWEYPSKTGWPSQNARCDALAYFGHGTGWRAGADQANSAPDSVGDGWVGAKCPASSCYKVSSQMCRLPTSDQETWVGAPEDRDALSLLMQETRAWFDEYACPSEMDVEPSSPTWKQVKPHTANLDGGGTLTFQSSPFSKGRKMMVTSATSPAIKRVQAGYDAKDIGTSEDYIGIMSYDFHGAWDTVTGPQAPLYNKERKSPGALLTDKIMPDTGKVDDFTIIRGNEVWNDPFDVKTGEAYPRSQVGVDHQKIYTGFSTYGRGWTLPEKINSANDPNFKYGTPSLCAQVPKPPCCPGCNGNGARAVTKERGITTLYDLEESGSDSNGNVLWDTDAAFRKFDEGTVTAMGASGDQFISYVQFHK